MAKFLSNAKTFAKDLARDAVHFPRTTESWPTFKQSLIELYNETKSDLFFFRKDTLHPALADATGQIDAALKLDAPALKAEQLLALKEAAAEKISALRAARQEKTNWAIGLTAGATILAGLALGGGALMCVMLAGSAAIMKFAMNDRAAIAGGATIEDKVDREILGMAAGDARTGLFNSPKFQQALVSKGVLKKVFTGANWGHTKEVDYAKTAAKVAQKQAVVAPAPASAPEKTSP